MGDKTFKDFKTQAFDNKLFNILPNADRIGHTLRLIIKFSSDSKKGCTKIIREVRHQFILDLKFESLLYTLFD